MGRKLPIVVALSCALECCRGLTLVKIVAHIDRSLKHYEFFVLGGGWGQEFQGYIRDVIQTLHNVSGHFFTKRSDPYIVR